MYVPSTFIAEQTIQKQKINEKHLLWHYSYFRQFCWLSVPWKTISKWDDRFTYGL